MTTPEKNRGYERQYFEGLTAEALQTRYKMGSPYQVWVKVRARNEPLDLAVYNRAAIEILQPDLEMMEAFCLVPKTIATSSSTSSPPRKRGGVVSKGI